MIHKILLILTMVMSSVGSCSGLEVHFKQFQLFNSSSASHARYKLSCEGFREAMDIYSVTYEYGSTKCSPLHPPCCHQSVASNVESVVKMSCSSRSSCSVYTAMQAAASTCTEGERQLARFTIHYRCVKSEHVFNLCEEKASLITEETPIMFTAPLFPNETYSKRACNCLLKMESSSQNFDQNLSFVRERMVELKNGEEVDYNYQVINQNGLVKITNSKRGNRTETKLMPIGRYWVEELNVALQSSQLLSGQSKVFLVVEPAYGLVVECNGVVVPNDAILMHVNYSIPPAIHISTTPEVSPDQLIDYKKRMKRAETTLVIVSLVSFLTIVVLVGLLWHSKRRRQNERTASDNEPEADSGNRSSEMLPIGELEVRDYSPLQKRKGVENERKYPEQIAPLVKEPETPIHRRKVHQNETDDSSGELAIGQEFKSFGKSNIEKPDQQPEKSGNVYSMEPTNGGPSQEPGKDSQQEDPPSDNDYEYPEI